MPKTAQSRTEGWPCSTDSTSAGATWKPLTLIISFERSVRWTQPSGSIQPTSPVRYHPSAKASAFASSGRYPIITEGLRAWISPTSPAGSASPESRSTTRSSTSGGGRPAESSRQRSGSSTGLAVITGSSLAP